MDEKINGYRIITEFTTSNAGMCKWAFAKKNGEAFFIKQMLSPKYPTPEIEKKLGASLAASMRRDADRFYQDKRSFYDCLAQCRTGNVVVAEDFFREGSFYYLTTKRVQGPFLDIDRISRLDEEKKRTLLLAVAYSMAAVHKVNIVHADLKPENVLTKETSAGFCTAKLIDFDSGFREGKLPEEIVGDQRYFSPEAIQYNFGETDKVTVKSDVFALGILFHQYWCGDFPAYNREEYESASIALLEGDKVTPREDIPSDVRGLIGRMLERDPEKRPTCREIWEILSGKTPTDDKPGTDPGLIIHMGKGRAGGSGGFHPLGDDDL